MSPPGVTGRDESCWIKDGSPSAAQTTPLICLTIMPARESKDKSVARLRRMG